METKKRLFELVSDRRYFHLVAFKEEKKFSLDKYWDICSFKYDKNFSIAYSFPNFEIQQRRIITNLILHGGDKDYSLNKDGEPPYTYDLFAIEINKGFFVFAFPFKSLARSITNSFNTGDILKFGSFIRADLNKLLKLNHVSDFINDDFSAHFVGLDFKHNGEPLLSNLGLNGDNPLQSIIYKTVFLDKINAGLFKVENCTMKVELLNKRNDSMPKSKANIHIDLFGNYKMYLHCGGLNLTTVPFLFDLLYNNNCLEGTLNNPINNIKDDESV